MTLSTQQHQAVIFDMDGLMLDTERLVMTAWKRAAVEFGYELPDAVYLLTLGRTAEDTRRILREALGGQFPYDEMRQRGREHADEIVQKSGMPKKPGLIELLDFLQTRGVPCAVATSTKRDDALGRLEAAGIRAYFRAVVAGDEVAHGKPAPDIFLAAADRLQVPPAACFVLEDSEAGVRAARAAGATPIMVPDLKEPSDEVRALAAWVFPSLHEVRALLATLFASAQPS